MGYLIMKRENIPNKIKSSDANEHSIYPFSNSLTTIFNLPRTEKPKLHHTKTQTKVPKAANMSFCKL